MKAITLSATALMLLGTLTLGMAEDVVTDVTVDEQITAIQEAPAQERVRMMNQFKERLATMNETEREAAITQLRTQTQTQARVKEGTGEGEQLQTRTQTQERSRVNQMQQTEDMVRAQEMNQMQQMNQIQSQVKQHLDVTPTPSAIGQ